MQRSERASYERPSDRECATISQRRPGAATWCENHFCICEAERAPAEPSVADLFPFTPTDDDDDDGLRVFAEYVH